MTENEIRNACIDLGFRAGALSIAAISMLSEGMSVKEIARSLMVSVRFVNLMKPLAVKVRDHLTREKYLTDIQSREMRRIIALQREARMKRGGFVSLSDLRTMKHYGDLTVGHVI